MPHKGFISVKHHAVAAKKLLNSLRTKKNFVWCVLNKLIKKPYIINEQADSQKNRRGESLEEKFLVVAILCHFPSEYFIRFTLQRREESTSVQGWNALKFV